MTLLFSASSIAHTEEVMARKTALLNPLCLVLFAAVWGCSGASPSSDGALTDGETATPTSENGPASPTDQASPTKAEESVGRTQEPWLGYGYAPYGGFGYGYSLPYYGGLGYGIAHAWGWSVTCVNGFCY
jgi:hypothetical protein